LPLSDVDTDIFHLHLGIDDTHHSGGHHQVMVMHSGLGHCEIDHVEKLSRKVSEYDEDNSRPEIPWLARVWARYAVEKSGETDNWYKI